MLSPKKPKHRKQQKRVRRIKGKADRGASLEFGDYGLKALQGGWISARQVEAARIALTRHAKRGGKVWIRIFPDKPLCQKPAEVRMGKGKGAPEKWVAEVQAGRIMYEITGVTTRTAKEALQRAASKLPIRCKVIERRASIL